MDHATQSLIHSNAVAKMDEVAIGARLPSYSELARALKAVSTHGKRTHRQVADDWDRARDLLRKLPESMR